MSYMEKKYYIKDEKHRQRILLEIDNKINEKRLEMTVFSTLAGGLRHYTEVGGELKELLRERKAIENYPLANESVGIKKINVNPFNPTEVYFSQPNVSMKIKDLIPCEFFEVKAISGDVLAIAIYQEKYYLCISRKNNQFELHDKRTLDYQVLAKREGWE